MGEVSKLPVNEVERTAREFLTLQKELSKNAVDYCIRVFKKWQKFNEEQRNELCGLTGLSYSRYKNIAAAGKKYSYQKAAIEDELGGKWLFPPTDVEAIVELNSFTKAELRKLVRDGTFDKVVTKTDLIRKKRGFPVALKQPKKVLSGAIAEINEEINAAANDLGSASTRLMIVFDLMNKNDLWGAQGLSVSKLKTNFNKLCEAMKLGNPDVTQNALKILRGEDYE